MATKKYTAAQIRKAREIIDQEEAIEYERERRAKLREARRDKEDRITYNPKPINPRLKRSLILFFGGLFVLWAINGYFGLTSVASEDSLYRRVIVWAVPLLWASVVGLWYWVGDPPTRVVVKRAKKSQLQQQRDFMRLNRDRPWWDWVVYGVRTSTPYEKEPERDPTQGKGDWFSIKEKKDSGQGDYS